MSERAGERVLNGRYALQGVLGGGGMAQVFRARDIVLGRPVAVKVLRDQYSHDPNFVQRFKREAQAAANLAHPNIASVYDVGEDQGLHYIVMELVPGETLRDLISREAPLPPDRAVDIAAQVLSALEYAHHNGLVHRDIKPGNVLIMPNGTVKVVDFGIAKGASDLSLTGAGLALGTAAYFSPEQAKGDRVLPQSDLYAVGCTIYEMLTGRVPFESDTDVGLAFKHISETPTPPRQLNPAIPPQLERIVLRALAKDPAQRFASAEQMEQALRNYVAFGAQRTAAMPLVPPSNTGAQAQAYARPAPAPLVQAARPQRGVQVNTGGSNSAFMTWILGLVALLLLLGGAVLALNGAAIFSPSTPTAVPTLSAATRTIPGVSTALATKPPTQEPTQAPTQVPTAAPSATTAPSATAAPSDTPAPPSATPAPTTPPVVQVLVPDVTSKSLQDAQTQAQQIGLTIKPVDQQADPNHPAGTIITQNPQSGTQVAQGSAIEVVVSTGPPTFPMPNMLNRDPTDAQKQLEGQGLKVTVKQEPNANVQEGAVSRQDPDPGTPVAAGDSVTIWVSQGDLIAVPDVNKMPEADALATLRSAGLNPSVRRMSEGDFGQAITQVDPGQAFTTDPIAGTQVQRGSDVLVIVRAAITTDGVPTATP